MKLLKEIKVHANKTDPFISTLNNTRKLRRNLHVNNSVNRAPELTYSLQHFRLLTFKGKLTLVRWNRCQVKDLRLSMIDLYKCVWIIDGRASSTGRITRWSRIKNCKWSVFTVIRLSLPPGGLIQKSGKYVAKEPRKRLELLKKWIGWNGCQVKFLPWVKLKGNQN